MNNAKSTIPSGNDEPLPCGLVGRARSAGLDFVVVRVGLINILQTSKLRFTVHSLTQTPTQFNIKLQPAPNSPALSNSLQPQNATYCELKSHVEIEGNLSQTK